MNRLQTHELSFLIALCITNVGQLQLIMFGIEFGRKKRRSVFSFSKNSKSGFFPYVYPYRIKAVSSYMGLDTYVSQINRPTKKRSVEKKGRFWERSGNVPGTFREQFDVPRTYPKRFENTLGTNREQPENDLRTNREHTGNIPRTQIIAVCVFGQISIIKLGSTRHKFTVMKCCGIILFEVRPSKSPDDPRNWSNGWIFGKWTFSKNEKKT